MAMASSSAELKSEIEMHIRYLKACQKIKLFAKRKITSQQTNEVLDRLRVLFITFDTDYIHIVKEGWGQTILELWQALMTFRNTLFRYFGKNKRESQGYQNLLSLLGVWWNLANGCREFGDELVASGVVPIVLEAIDDNDDINRSILGLLHNCIRMSHQNRDAFRNANAIPVLKRCLKSMNKCIQVNALMIMAYIVNENEREILATSERGLRVLLNAFIHATNTEDHTVTVETMNIEWSGFELLDAINHLAINDTNKAEIEKQGAIPAIIRMLHDDISSDEERRVAADTLWNLSFDESIRESEILQNAIPTLLQLGKSTSSKELRVACVSALWEINGSMPERVSTSASVEDSPPTYKEATADLEPSEDAPTQVMLSYQWDSQQLVLKIKDRLQNAGYSVWMDISNIRGDILIAMAKAVKKSDVILLCMSERYQESRSCRSEATYAYKLKKQIIPLMLEPGYEPDGWLGLLQGMDLYYGFQSEEELEKNMPTLLKVIGENAATENAEDTVDGPITPQKQETTCSGPAMSSPNPAAAAWTDKDVQDWLRKKKLNCPTLEAFDGSDLQELYVQLQKDDNAFKHELKTGFHMDSPTSVRFTSALRKLFAE